MKDNAILEKLIDALHLNYKPDYTGDPIFALPHCNANYGFFDLRFKDNRILILKNVHKDFVRVIEGKRWLNDTDYSKISDYLSNIEKNLDDFKSVTFAWEYEVFYLIDINGVSIYGDCEKSTIIPRPLTKVEYSLFSGEEVNNKTLWIKGVFGSIFPETVTPLMGGIFKKLPDVLNPLFSYVNFKCFSPSIKLIFNKPYANLRNFNAWCSTLLTDDLYINLNFIQHLYLKTGYKKIKIPKTELMKLDNNELLEFLSEIDSIIKQLDESFVLTSDFYDLIALIVMSAEINGLFLMHSFLKLFSITGDLEITLQLIYQTRPTNIFLHDLQIVDYFDFDTNTVYLDKLTSYSPIDQDTLINGLPYTVKLLKKKTIKQLLKELHEQLDIKDRLFTQANNLMLKLKNIFLNIGQEFVDNRQFKSKEEIFYLEIEEIVQVKEGNYYGNLAFNNYFRKTQLERFKAQRIPSEIFEKDIPDTEEIVNRIFEKLKDKNEIPTLTLFFKDDIKSPYITDHSRLSNIAHINDHDAIIAENIPLFSHLMEYATITNTPIFTGIRFPRITLSNRQFSINKKGIKIDG
jgi:hypothetical protein